jgi:hypothetical protein
MVKHSFYSKDYYTIFRGKNKIKIIKRGINLKTGVTPKNKGTGRDNFSTIEE